MLYDAHNHLQDAWLVPHRSRVFADLATIPLARAVVNGTSESDWPEVASLARLHPFILPSYGLHPWNVGNASAGWRQTLERQVGAEPNAAIGEIGLDRWMLERARPDDPRLAGLLRAPLDQQLESFVWQLDLATRHGRAVTVHCIDAWGALLETLRRCPPLPHGFLLHAYGGSAEMAREFHALGAFFSFNGYFLGDRQAAKRDVFKTIPLDRLLIETDAPAMPPPAARRSFELPGLADGNPVNHPANIGAIYEAFAKLREVSLESLEAQLQNNFGRLFMP